jgi:uncharacterized membrane protein
MIVVTIYLKKTDADYLSVRDWLNELQAEIPHKVVDINVSYDEKMQQRMGDSDLLLQVGPYLLRYPFTAQELRVSLMAARDRQKHYEAVEDKGYASRVDRGKTLSGADRFSLWFSRAYMYVIFALLFLYTGLPVLAPVLMKNNITGPAQVIYTIYRPFCHQLGFRSIFLFGEQFFYPRALAHLDGYKTYEQLTGQSEIDIIAARNFTGNEEAGYKIALCQRDMAIYASLSLFALIYLLSGRKLPGIPWYVWLLLGVGPIALDGFSQLPGIVSNVLPSWMIIRESTPVFRFVTGALFGFMTAWYLFPKLEETMSDLYAVMKRKSMVIEQMGDAE